MSGACAEVVAWPPTFGTATTVTQAPPPSYRHRYQHLIRKPALPVSAPASTPERGLFLFRVVMSKSDRHGWACRKQASFTLTRTSSRAAARGRHRRSGSEPSSAPTLVHWDAVSGLSRDRTSGATLFSQVCTTKHSCIQRVQTLEPRVVAGNV